MSLFLYPWLLLLILPVILMAVYAWFRKQPSIRVPSLNAAKKAAASGRRRRINWKRLIPFLLYTGSMVLLVVALARPREGLEQIRRRAEGIDIILALDLSGSMVAVDIPKQMTRMAQVTAAIDRGTLKNRIQTAKEEIAKFIQARPNDRIGLIAFAPLPYMACPPTLDHAWLLANLDHRRQDQHCRSDHLRRPASERFGCAAEDHRALHRRLQQCGSQGHASAGRETGEHV